MATETISWSTISGGDTVALSSATQDTGEVIANVTGTPGSSGNVAIRTDTPANLASGSHVELANNSSGSTSTLAVSFADDAGSADTYGAFDASFSIHDIDAGGFRDEVKILALNSDGNPLTISVSAGSNMTVSGPDADGYVTILANPSTNSLNSPNSTANITVNGGPIASISVGFTNVAVGQNNMLVTDITYSSQLICFAAGTLIETADGPVAAEELQVGDMVLTADHGYQPVRWIGVNSLSAQTLKSAAWMRPVRISAGALGDGLPEQDLVVSPQHRVLVRSKIAQKMFGENEVLVAAKQLVTLDGIDICDDLDGVTYVHFLCDQHEVVFANGAPSESLFTGPEALKGVGSKGRAELFALFPELQDVDYRALSARPLTSGRLGRKLAHRHMQNAKALLAPTAH